MTALKSRLSRTERTLVRAALGDRLYALVPERDTMPIGLIVVTTEVPNTDDATDLHARMLIRAIRHALLEVGAVVALKNVPTRARCAWHQVYATAKGMDALVQIVGAR
jgi:hypothetical protein